MPQKKITRWQASGLHLGISAAIAAGALAVMLLVWYPPPLFEADGGTGLLLIMVGVDVVLGPLITLVIFRQGKRGLKLDLAIIGTLQLAALAYGMHVVFIARPAFIVFNRDHFEVAHAADLEPEELAKARFPQFASLPLAGPRWASVVMPQDPAARSKLALAAMAGRDLQQFPAIWAPYEERREDVLAHSMSLEQVREREPKYAPAVEAALSELGIAPRDARIALLRARRAWVAVVLDRRTAQPRRMLIVERL